MFKWCDRAQPRLVFAVGVAVGTGVSALALACLLQRRRAQQLQRSVGVGSLSWRGLCAELLHAGSAPHILLSDCRVPASAVTDSCPDYSDILAHVDEDGFARLDVILHAGRVQSVTDHRCGKRPNDLNAKKLEMGGRILCTRFVDAHVHMTKTHLHPRCRNPTGSMNDAIKCEGEDRKRWLNDQSGCATAAVSNSLARRLDFALRCAYRHGSRAVRTHLDGVQDGGQALRDTTYEVFTVARQTWAKRGLVLQGVANMFLPHYGGDCGRTIEEAREHVLEAKKHAGVVLGAYCPKACAEGMFDPAHFDKWFTALFKLATEFDLPVDLHLDEHNDSAAEALALPSFIKAVQTAQQTLGYSRPIVLGHCTALALVSDESRRKELLASLASLGPQVVVIANPLTNMWLQDRRGTSADIGQHIDAMVPRTPQWRGITLMQELKAAGVRVGAASDNVRDWWFPYGDYDVLEVFRMAVLLAHLDTTHDDGHPPAFWLAELVSHAPALALELPDATSFLERGMPLQACVFNARSISELLARPQADRFVLMPGRDENTNEMQDASALLHGDLPSFDELDDIVSVPTIMPQNLSGAVVRRGGGVSISVDHPFNHCRTDLTEYMMAILAERSYSFTTTAEREVVRMSREAFLLRGDIFGA